MFIIFKLFENIKSFKVDEFSNEILQRIDNNLLINGQINVLNIQDELTLKNKKLYYNKGWSLEIFNLETNQINHISDKTIQNVNYKLSDYLVLVTKNKEIFLYDIKKENQILLNQIIFNWGKIFISKLNFFLYQHKIIESYKIPTSEKLWQIELSLLGKFQTEFDGEKDYEVRQFVGIYNDILWMFLNSSEFIGLESHSGKIVHWLKGVKKENVTGKIDEYLNETETYIFFDINYLLDYNLGKIIGLKADRYYEIDLKANVVEPTMLGLYTKMENLGIDKNDTCNNIVLKENHLYFYNIHKLKFAIFDIDTKQIIYVSEKLTNDQTKRREIKDLQVANNKVYVLDSTGDLHIFEKEKLS